MTRCHKGCTCNRHRKCEPGCECGRHKAWNKKPAHEIGYIARHIRVYNERGKAREHQCIECGDQAAEWAQIHETDGTDPQHYQPMCVKCHRRYDNTPQRVSNALRGRNQSPETVARRSASLREAYKRNPRSREISDRINEKNRGQKRSAESRERMRQSALARHARERLERATAIE